MNELLRGLSPKEVITVTLVQARGDSGLRRLLETIINSEDGATMGDILVRASRRRNEGDEVRVSPQRVLDLIENMTNRGVIELNNQRKYSLTNEAHAQLWIFTEPLSP